MLCFFCKSDNHLSKNCNIYGTDETRIAFLSKKGCCKKRLGIPDKYNIVSKLCEYFISQQKCYCWFSRSHYTNDCINKFTVTTFFLPTIDQDLLPRFMELLEIEEKYFLCFTFPKLLNFFTPKPLKITYRQDMSFPCSQTFSDSDFVVADKVKFENFFVRWIGINNKSGICGITAFTNFRIKYLELCDCLLAAKEVLQLLSHKTKSLHANVNFSSALTLRELLQKAPNLYQLDLAHTNIVISNSWPDDVFRYASKMAHICLPVVDFGFNVESLATLIRKRHVYINLLHIGPSTNTFYEIAFENVTNIFSSHFIEIYGKSFDYLKVTLQHKFGGRDYTTIKDYKLKIV